MSERSERGMSPRSQRGVSARSAAPGIGDMAPAFMLPGTSPTAGGVQNYSLADFAGQPVVIAFYPGDDTSVCTNSSP